MTVGGPSAPATSAASAAARAPAAATGTAHSPRTAPTAAHLGLALSYIAVKLKIKNFDDDTDMVCLEFEIDKKVEWHLLERPRYTSSPAAAIRSWVLLEARPLHDVSSDMSVRVL